MERCPSDVTGDTEKNMLYVIHHNQSALFVVNIVPE